jgi:copper(I)-binding protein
MRWFIAVLAGLALVACGGDDLPTDGGLVGTAAEVHVYDAWVAQTGDETADVSMRVHNAGAQDDRLLAATCACEATVEIDGALVVGPDEEVVMAPGGTPGLSLTDLTEDLPRGDFVALTLTFEHAGDVVTDVEIRKPSG